MGRGTGTGTGTGRLPAGVASPVLPACLLACLVLPAVCLVGLAALIFAMSGLFALAVQAALPCPASPACLWWGVARSTG